MRFHLKGYFLGGQKFRLILFLIRAVLCNCLLPRGDVVFVKLAVFSYFICKEVQNFLYTLFFCGATTPARA